MIRLNLIIMLFLFSMVNCGRNKAVPSQGADPDIQKHENWGWKPVRGEYNTHAINRITIHHGGVEFNGDEDPVQHLQNLQNWSRNEKGWIDIPYHYMIDLDGIIYEARPIEYPGDTNTDYDVQGHALICVMGNYEIQKINQKQLDKLIGLTAYLAKKYHIPADSIRGHKDYTETACPGKDLYRYLEDGTIRQKVIELLNNSQN